MEKKNARPEQVEAGAPGQGSAIFASTTTTSKRAAIAQAMAQAADAEKQFQTLRAAYAMRGHALYRTDPADGPVTYCAERWGLVRYLPTLDDARLFLKQIGGRV